MQSSDEQTNHDTRRLDLNTQKGDKVMMVATKTRLGQLQLVVAKTTTTALLQKCRCGFSCRSETKTKTKHTEVHMTTASDQEMLLLRSQR